jgi:hypothetical protein
MCAATPLRRCTLGVLYVDYTTATELQRTLSIKNRGPLGRTCRLVLIFEAFIRTKTKTSFPTMSDLTAKYEMLDELGKQQLSEFLDRLLTRQQPAVWQKMLRPGLKKFDLAALIQHQKYRGFDRQRFDQLVRQMDIQEPTDELQASLRP